jgi:3'(2'), 5'-bisphosphate nucleotidase
MTDIDTLAPALLARAAELATRAAAVIMQIRARGFETLTKADETPVTEADHAAEAIILEGLRQPVPGHPSIPVIAEEEVAAGLRIDTGDCFWLVDPLDGTREFAAGRETFTVNIGLVHHRRVVLGAVALPAFGQLYLGIVGQGAVRRDAAGEHAIRARAAPPEGLSVLASRHYANDPTLLAYLGTQRIASVGNIGSAAKFVRIAEGVADLYPRLGRTMEWDTAAPQAVLEAAGGSVSLFDGTPLSYGKPGWENPHFVCRGRMDGRAA